MTSLTTPTFAAEGLLSRLKANGIDYLFANGGTDFAPIIEGYANGIAKETPLPKAVIVPHETAAIAMAHGYYLVTGKAQAVMVHVNVGLGNCVMGIVNAAQENIPMLVMSGRTPLTEFGRNGSRMTPVQYAQEMRDQGSMVRELVKWDYELRYGDQVDVLVDRATTVAMSEPRGPVYLSLPREPLAEAMGPDYVPGRPVQAVPVPAAPDAESIRRAAAALAKAKNPIIICQRGDTEGRLGQALGEFASKFAIPVIEFWSVRNVLATDHPMQAGYDVGEWLPNADVVLVIDSPTPWIQRNHKPMAGAKVIHLGTDPLFTRWPVRSFPIDLAITAAPAAGVAALHAEMAKLNPDTAARYKAVEEKTRARREGARKKAMGGNGSPMTPAYVGHCLSQAMDDKALFFSELGAPIESLTLKGTNRYLNNPFSGGLGWGMGAALGASLADRDRLVIACMGDGSYMFANPVACHQIAEAHHLPILTVVMNNGIWNAVRRAALSMYPKGQASGMDVMPITSLEPAPDYCAIARASRGWAEEVENAADLPGAIQRAVEVIRKEKRQALLNVRVAY
jgi:acetolactate synthase-1/2/3 large subunit